MLHRVFRFLEGSGPSEPGGALFVPRERQGSGRHDNPQMYGALYASRSAIAAVAERVQAFRGQRLTERDFDRIDGTRDALVTIDDDALGNLLDLDDPQHLSERGLRPSRVATRDRTVTRPLAAVLYREGWAGFEWWSTLEASWTNASLFADRAVPRLEVMGNPEPLTLDMSVVREAADALGIRIA